MAHLFRLVQSVISRALGLLVVLALAPLGVQGQSFICDSTLFPTPPPAPKVTTFNLGHSVAGGQTLQAYIGLSDLLPTGCTLTVRFLTHNPIVHAPATQTITLFGGFYTWSTDGVQNITPVQVDLYDTYAPYNQPTISAQVFVLPIGTPAPRPQPPPTPQLAGIAVTPNVVVSGRRVNLTVFLVSPAPSNGTSVLVSSDNPSVAPVPSTVLVPAGQTQVTADVLTRSVSQDRSVTISASLLGLNRTATLNVLAISAVPTYNVADLGTLGGSSSRAFGLTEAGDVVGGSETDAALEHAFLWSPGAGMTDLGVLPNRTTSRAYAANYVFADLQTSGSAMLIVTGRSDVGPCVYGQPYSQPFVWYGGSIHANVYSAFSGSGRGITPYGILLLSGDECYLESWVQSPWNASTSECNLGWCPITRLAQIDYASSSDPVRASAITNGGKVAGFLFDATFGGDRAAIWDVSKASINITGEVGVSPIELGVLPSGTDSHAYGASDAGDIVGSSALPDGEHAFRWLAGSMVDLSTLPGASDSTANAVNLYGFVVGRSGGKAVIWDQFNTIIDLNVRIPSGTGWALTEAHAINTAGQIVGEGIHNGQTRAFLLTPGLPPACGSDVSSSIQVARGGFRINASNGHFMQLLTLTNVGATPIAGPVALALDGLSGYAGLSNASGYTSCDAPVGSPYLLANLGMSSVLSPNASVSVLLNFNNPPKQGIEYSTRTLTGATF